MAKAAKKKPPARKKAAKIKPLATIGYQQAVQSRVIDELRHAKVDILVDVRAVAASRKPGFSKNQLAAGLDEKGIAYLHFQKLGTPKEGREAARAGNMNKLFGIYSRHLKTKGAQEEMDDLTDLMKSGKRICLLCFERNPDECHRQWIAEEMERRTGAKVHHLAADLL
jgi:uncharacterized protein (DUF488 family)